jgi:hypothetical protein
MGLESASSYHLSEHGGFERGGVSTIFGHDRLPMGRRPDVDARACGCVEGMVDVGSAVELRVERANPVVQHEVGNAPFSTVVFGREDPTHEDMSPTDGMAP